MDLGVNEMTQSEVGSAVGDIRRNTGQGKLSKSSPPCLELHLFLWKIMRVKLSETIFGH
jgi:hypothetical protein